MSETLQRQSGEAEQVMDHMAKLLEAGIDDGIERAMADRSAA